MSLQYFSQANALNLVLLYCLQIKKLLRIYSLHFLHRAQHNDAIKTYLHRVVGLRVKFLISWHSDSQQINMCAPSCIFTEKVYHWNTCVLCWGNTFLAWNEICLVFVVPYFRQTSILLLVLMTTREHSGNSDIFSCRTILIFPS